METEKIELKIVISCLLFIFLIEGIAGYLIADIQVSAYIKIGILRVCEVIVFFTLISFWGNGFSSIGLDKMTLLHGMKCGLLYSFLFGLITGIIAIITWLTYQNPLSFFRFSISNDISVITQLFIVGGLIAPLAEEIFFRGILFGYLRRWGILSAITITTLIFVSLHMTNGIPVTQAVGGIVFAISYEKSKSLLTPIIIHILGNSAIFSLSLLSIYA